MKNINPTKTFFWKKLKDHFKKIKNIKISDFFLQENNRFEKFSICFLDQILVDYSKNRINSETIKKLINLTKEIDLKNAIKDMFNGEKINFTENSPVLHTALRNKSNKAIIVDNKDIMPEIKKSLKKIKKFSENIINGKWKGYSGHKITDIVNIGIGGSDLGPSMVTKSLKAYKNHLNMHFVSNIDGTHISETLKKINRETTLFIISSKTFTTQETLTNARTAYQWFLLNNSIKNLKYHFIAITANTKKAKIFGINKKNIFKIWDWVGGRYSLWSSIGLPISLSLGFDNFSNLLNGAYEMDKHFSNAPEEKNIPIILALISIWYSNFFYAETEAVLVYDQYMYRFAAYLQQSNMESNGKCIDRNGKKIKYQTGPIIWGEPGTNGQHAFYQLLHQGTKLIPCDFIIPVQTHNLVGNHHLKLMSNFFAQTESLAFGKPRNLVEKELIEIEKNINLMKNIIPYKVFEGNRPSNSILIKKINPFNLGALIALYEHKIFAQGIILNIFSFDQWGVELGKTLASKIEKELKKNVSFINSHDSSTNGLINCYKSWLL